MFPKIRSSEREVDVKKENSEDFYFPNLQIYPMPILNLDSNEPYSNYQQKTEKTKKIKKIHDNPSSDFDSSYTDIPYVNIEEIITIKTKKNKMNKKELCEQEKEQQQQQEQEQKLERRHAFYEKHLQLKRLEKFCDGFPIVRIVK
jgi:hypothetical protein